MFFIVMLHTLGKDNIIDYLTKDSWLYYVVWLIYAMATPAVNCYALISGYVGYKSSHKYSGLITLHLQVLFYSFLGLGIGCFMTPENVSIMDAVKTVFPVRFNTYWYYSAYFCLFLLMPLLSKIFDNRDKRFATRFVVIILLVFSVAPTFLMKDMFGASSGYSFLWLSLLYVVGVYLNKYDVCKSVKTYKLLLPFIAMLLITWVSKLIIEVVTEKVIGSALYGDILFSYTSPTIVLMSIFIILIFANLKLKDGVKRIIGFVAPLSFGVYLLHENPYVSKLFIRGKFNHYLDFNPMGTLLAVVGTVVAIFMIGIIIEWLRQRVFFVLRIKRISEKIEGLIKGLYNYLYLKLSK